MRVRTGGQMSVFQLGCLIIVVPLADGVMVESAIMSDGGWKHGSLKVTLVLVVPLVWLLHVYCDAGLHNTQLHDFEENPGCPVKQL